ncbi:hypothetical protein ACJ73_09784 [Blastomyces percursus]|uniref:Uncharacterized protein n=1 Tax=Blastomyces percursus TaxID=1658174 RepID=A0A1J9P278_9EURO|nr:hypothetical protein ACJ73_09784 [Blastomyces percursus]
MATLVDHIRYNDLPSLGEADISREHRHHIVNAKEAIVKVEGTAHLMDSQAVNDIVSFGNLVVPTTWMTSGGQLHPMEFSVTPARYVVFFPIPSLIL